MTNLAFPGEILLLPLDSPQASLDMAGGKGANLAKLKRAGFLVPDGFNVTTCAYRCYVREYRLDEQINGLLAQTDLAQPAELERISAHIQAFFSVGHIPGSLVEPILAAYQRMGAGPVAVRSSATAEDLPDLSFAGQQDTYLNICGPEQLLRAVVDCWASLWTARAIGYRHRNQVPQSASSLAVVVQEMVESQVSGVMFTANPLTGLRTETVIDATIGLGEALVSGRVEPDHYVVDTTRRQIRSKTLGAKMLSIHGQESGGTWVREQDRIHVQALPDEQILALADLGEQVEELYRFPQDIEWAWADDRLYLLQSRPVTSLFPLPDGMTPEPLVTMFSFAAVQGIVDPMTPLGIDTIAHFPAAVAELMGTPITAATQRVFLISAGRIWGNFTPLLKNKVGRQLVSYALGMVEPSIGQALAQILDDPRLQPGKKTISFRAAVTIARFVLPLAGNILLNMASPRRRREMIVGGGECMLEKLEVQAAAIQGDPWQKLAQRAVQLPNVAMRDLSQVFLLFVSGVAAGMAAWNFLNMLARTAPEPAGELPTRDLVMQVTRGMPYNPTTEMDLALWSLAKELRQDPQSLAVLQSQPPAQLAACYLAGHLPEPILRSIREFLSRYGGRGFCEIDLGRERWADDPTHVFEMLSSFMQINNESLAPDVVFARGAASAQEAVDLLARRVRSTRLGGLKAALVRFFAGRARQFMGARESPKFFAVRMFAISRREILKSGRELVQLGALDDPEDLMYLTFAELSSFAGRDGKDYTGLIASRREAYRREQRRSRLPRMLLSDGRAFYEGIMAPGSSANVLIGSPVSPGSIEGRVRVVFDPREAHLHPGEIMVCPGTDPSWTPLFLSAAGLIMEMGGMMTHGAVVAREYGIPAVVGVHQATRRLETGQLVRLDGSSGQIVIVEET